MNHTTGLVCRLQDMINASTFRFTKAFGVRLYVKRTSYSGKKNLKLATTVGSKFKKDAVRNSKGDSEPKPKENVPSTFNYGKYGGLKENNSKHVDVSSKILNKVTDFDQLKILPEVRMAVKKIIANETLAKNLTKDSEVVPSPIQVVAVKTLAKKLMDPKLQHHAIAAETGSGKTMAYLIPMLDYLKRQEAEYPEIWESLQKKAIIRSIILVPTHELVDQVYKTIKLSEDLLDLHTYKWDSGSTYPELIEKIKSRIDIMVTTPAKILTLFNIRMISRADKILSQVKFVALDEADTLLDKSWVEDTHRAIKFLPNTNHLVFCSATIPNEFNKTLERLFPNTVPITTPRLHKLPKSLDFKIIDASLNPFKNSKMKALAQTLYAITNDGTEPGFEKRCLVFVNEKKDVPQVVERLTEVYGHNCVGLTGDDTVKERLEKIQEFVNPPKPLKKMVPTSPITESRSVLIPGSNISMNANILESSKNGSGENNVLKVLVSTDLMARGLNFQGVRNLVLYDVPQTSIDLIHRVGRTARMKQSGRVFMLIDKKTKSWAKGLPKVVKKNMTLT